MSVQHDELNIYPIIFRLLLLFNGGNKIKG